MYRVRNWHQFQHYKDRNPPWIKLHFALLSSPDWVMLDDASRVLAVACMLIASRNDGQIDGSEAGRAYLKRVAYLSKPPNLKPLIECGFLEPASALLADASALQANARPETETETETEERQRRLQRKPAKVRIPEDFVLTPELTAYVAVQIPDADAGGLFATFADQAKAKGWEYADWSRAFQVYVRNCRANSGHFAAGRYPKSKAVRQWV